MTLAERIARYSANPPGSGYSGIEEDREAIAKWAVICALPALRGQRLYDQVYHALEALEWSDE